MTNPYEDDDYALPDSTPGDQPKSVRDDKPIGIPDYDGIHAQSDAKRPKTEDEIKNIAGYLIASSGKKYYLQPGANVIGRGDVDFVLEDKTVSRKHCVIEVDTAGGRGNYQYFLYDIGHNTGTNSKNGTYVVGRTPPLEASERVIINNGTRIVLGLEKVTLHVYA